MSEQEIKLEFSYTEAEYLSASRLLAFRTSDVMMRLIAFLVLVMVGLMVIPVLIPEFPIWAAVALALLVEAALLYNFLVRVPQQCFRGDRKFRDNYAFMFSNEGISVKTNQLDSKLSWSLYTKVIEGSGLYILVYGKDLRMMTVVPKRAFPNEMQENAFRDLLARHIGPH